MKFYLAKNENTGGSWIYIYGTIVKDVEYLLTFTINTDNQTVYTKDIWSEHLLTQSHISKISEEKGTHDMIKLLFMTPDLRINREEG